MVNPWTFGWTQLLTIIGFIITVSIAAGGFRTFNRWKREKIEEKRIEIAMEALSLTYETKWVFQHIRSPLIMGWETDQLERPSDESVDSWDKRKGFVAILKRIVANKDYFDRLWKLQPRFMAAFSPETEAVFLLVHQSRRDIEVAASMLMQEGDYRQMDDTTRQLYEKMRRDIWDHQDSQSEKDTIGKRLNDFKEKMERLCRPILDKEYARALRNALSEEAAREEHKKTLKIIAALQGRLKGSTDAE